jgi:hypothetical protein
MTDSEKIAARIAQNRAIDQRVAQSNSPGRSLRSLKVSFVGNDAVGFSHSDTFPVIASVITTLCAPGNEFVGHREIVAAMLADPHLGWLLDQIFAKDPNEYPREWWANNMMAWFSQTITTGRNSYTRAFEREPGITPYRYRLRKKE